MSCEKKIKIILHGYLRKLVPDSIVISGSTVAEVINGFCRQTKAFDVPPDQDRHCIQVVGYSTRDSLFEKLPDGVTELHLVPEFSAGKGGFFKIIIGAVLIAAAIYMPASIGAVGLFGTETTIAGLLTNMGVSLVLGGLLEMLSPAPKYTSQKTEGDPEASKYLGAGQNSVRIGTRIPLAYGEVKMYGHYLSFDVDAKDVAL